MTDEPEKPSPERPFSDYKIHLFDGDQFEMGITKQLLAALDIKKLKSTGDKDEASGNLSRNRPDIVIVGLSEKNNDALDLIRQVRVEEKLEQRDVPILLLMSEPTKEAILAARDAGATEIAGRPISADALGKRLRTMISKPRDFVKASAYTGPDRRRKDLPENYGQDRRS